MVTCAGKDHRVKVAGTPDDPYFCGKDVWFWDIVTYSNVKQALQVNIQIRDKLTAKELGEVVGLPDKPTFMSQTNLRNLTHNESRAVYINEPGLYNLILRSNAPHAGEFQDLVTRKILPDIRKYGQFNLNRDYLALQDMCKEQTLALEASSKENEKLRRDVTCFKNYIKEVETLTLGRG